MIHSSDAKVLYEGGCFCGNIRYYVCNEPEAVAICHCSDCRKSSGAPMVVWALYKQDSLVITCGYPKQYNSSGAVIRSFCSDCGCGLFYRNPVVIPGRIDIQSSTFDDADHFIPQAQIQTAERLVWMKSLQKLPEFERFPSQKIF